MIRRLVPILALCALLLRGALPAAAMPGAGLDVVLCGSGGDPVVVQIDLGAPPPHPGSDCADHCLGALPGLPPVTPDALPVRIAAPMPAEAATAPLPRPIPAAAYRVRAPPRLDA